MMKYLTYYIIEPLYWWWLQTICRALPTCTLWRPAKTTRQFEFVLCPAIKIDELTVVLAQNGAKW